MSVFGVTSGVGSARRMRKIDPFRSSASDSQHYYPIRCRFTYLHDYLTYGGYQSCVCLKDCCDGVRTI